MLSLTLDAVAFAARRRKAQTDLEARLVPVVRTAIEAGDAEWDDVIDLAVNLLGEQYTEESGQPLGRATRAWERRLEAALDKGSYEDVHSVNSTALWLATAILSEATTLAAIDDEAELFLEWVDMADKAVRDAHRETAGQVRPIGEKFDVAGVEMTGPGDVTAPPALWVNCRCTLRPRLASEFHIAYVQAPVDLGLLYARLTPEEHEYAQLFTEYSIGPTMTVTEGEAAAVPTGYDDALGVPWYGIWAVEDKWTGDKRRFRGGSLSTRPVPLPLTWQKFGDDGHKGYVTVAMAEDAFVEDGMLHTAGRFLQTVPEADEAIGLMAEFGRFGVSVDADSTTFELAPNDEGIDYTAARVSSACILPIPAFAEAWVTLGVAPWLDKRKGATKPEDEGERPPEANVPESDMLKPDNEIPTTPDGAPAIKDDDEEDPRKRKRMPVAARAVDSAERDRLKGEGKALPDGGFPIANVEDLRNAIQAIGRAKDPDAAKAHIKKRARDLGAENLIPDGWSMSEQLVAMRARSTEFLDVSPGRTEDGPGWLTNPVDTDRIRDYWVRGPGAAKIGWGTPGDFNRCRAAVAQYVKPQHLNGYCANRHFDALGFWPGRPVAGDTTPFAAQRLGADEKPGPALSLVASLGHKAPAAWFDNPGFALDDGRVVQVRGLRDNRPPAWACPFTITDEGRVYGHVAAWGMCHLNSELEGLCVEPPHSMSDYAYFLNSGVVPLDDGRQVPVGQVTLGGGHAADGLSMRAALAHYDSTSTVVCDVNAGEDEFGPWVAGWVRPGTSDEMVTAMRASAVSPDWREANGNLEMIACLAVNVGGMGMPRPRATVVNRRQVSLVASAGIIAPAAQAVEQAETEMAAMGVPNLDALAIRIALEMHAIEDRKAKMRELRLAVLGGDD